MGDKNLSSNREKYLDVAKAIGIILVVIGHADSPIQEFIYLFHMQVFFFISGYFYKDNYSDNPAYLIKRRLKTLYLPFVKYELIFLILHNIFFYINIYSDKIGHDTSVSHIYSNYEFFRNMIKIITFSGTEELAGAFWFFTSLFTVNVLFLLISYISDKYNKNIRVIAILIFYFIGNLASMYSVNNFHEIFTSFVMLLIYYSGYFYKKNSHEFKFNIYIALIALAILLISNFYGKIDVGNNYYTNPIFFIVNSYSGIYLIIYISKKIILMNKFISLIEYIGRNTIIIIALHFLAFKLVNFVQVKIYQYPIYMIAKFPNISGQNDWWFIYSIVGVFIPISIKYVLDKLKELINIKYNYAKGNANEQTK